MQLKRHKRNERTILDFQVISNRINQSGKTIAKENDRGYFKSHGLHSNENEGGSLRRNLNEVYDGASEQKIPSKSVEKNSTDIKI
jgi:hypothetical protein